MVQQATSDICTYYIPTVTTIPYVLIILLTEVKPIITTASNFKHIMLYTANVILLEIWTLMSRHKYMYDRILVELTV